jgi:hypothetical protein
MSENGGLNVNSWVVDNELRLASKELCEQFRRDAVPTEGVGMCSEGILVYVLRSNHSDWVIPAKFRGYNVIVKVLDDPFMARAAE